MLGVGREGLGDHDVDGHRQAGALGGEHGEHLAAFIDELGLGEGLADRLARSEKERVENAAADDQAVDLFGEVGEDRELRGDLGAADNGGERVTGLLDARTS